MDVFFALLGLAAGAFLLTLGIIAFIFLHQGKVNSQPVQLFSRYGNSRHNGKLGAVAYYAWPLLVLFFWSSLGGLMVIAAMIMGIFFTKKLTAVANRPTYVAPSTGAGLGAGQFNHGSATRNQAMGGHIQQVKASGPIAGDPTGPRNIA